jgi:quercetin dioxygenase-like cupin family protein
MPVDTLRPVTTRTRPGTGVRVLVVAALAVAALAGCAQPGQLGHPLPAAAPAPAPVAPLGLPAQVQASPVTGLLGSGLVTERVSMRSAGPAEFSVETVVLGPGESSPWHRHPGTELSLVRSGEVTVQRGENCEPLRYSAGHGVFVGDAEPHVVRNDGPVPAELVVTQLLAPGAPEDEAVEPAC